MKQLGLLRLLLLISLLAPSIGAKYTEGASSPVEGAIKKPKP